MNEIKLILFDLGGVVVRWVGIQALSDLTGLSVQNVAEKFSSSDIANRFERGLCSHDDFIQEFRQLFQLTGSDTELIALWNSWVQSPYEGIEDAIYELKKFYRVACLSNTNELHWKHLSSYMDLDRLFDPGYASHHIHEAKPNMSCYQYVIENLKLEPEQILFLDDTQANVDAAKNAGIQAHKVDPQFGALPLLGKLGLI